MIRKVTSGDRSAVRAMMLEYIVGFYQQPAPASEKLDLLQAMLLQGENGLQFVAEEDGAYQGFVTLYFTYSTLRAQRVVIMNDLYVRDQYRGTGVAESLFRACEQFTKENGFAALQWETAKDNHRAQRFYEKMGGKQGDWLNYTSS
ncbi:GNAT family N-acetyltransferase [Tumebacillus algifaecis]|uniref:GNAT family N-acetyltransferase n=1 Tax=Tumebacillus algifaecis TaxID=1214604 RepID=A0A223D665_9BACL|nr:GNAT family N-acetyltransferase [Tumebacillus algifaecis]ASS77061.1 GNAT family N-acetyltransferase [Tumebacillus algifaecis]